MIKLRVMNQQKRDVIQGIRMRTFSDLIRTPDHKNEVKNVINELKQDKAFVTFVDGDK